MPYFLAPLWRTNTTELSEGELWEHLEKCLSAHDWYYMASEDDGVWQAGEEQKSIVEELMSRLRLLDANRADLMYYTACPWTAEDGTRIPEHQ